MIQTIIFATDMGLHTHYLLHHVNALAMQHNARVIVVHAIEPPGYIGEAVVQSFLGHETRREIAQEGMDRIIQGVKTRIVDMLEEEFIDGQLGLSRIRDVRVVAGKPVDVIIDQVNDYNADLIILGSHGQNTAQPNMLGGVASRILQLSRVPIYMVPLVRNFGCQAKAS